MMRLQRCADCAATQYPPREFCGRCLSDRLAWDSAEALPARVVARTVLYHSNEEEWRARLPLTLGLVRFDGGAVAVCFLSQAAVGGAVQVHVGEDGMLHATPCHVPHNRHRRPRA
jgi:uncharacterized OB-fold protein